VTCRGSGISSSINPAFEAELFSSLSDMSLERATYFESQLPVLAVLTSETDDATKAFTVASFLPPVSPHPAATRPFLIFSALPSRCAH